MAFEFKVGGIVVCGTAGQTLSVTAVGGASLAPDEAVLLARVLLAVCAPVPQHLAVDYAAIAALDALLRERSAGPAPAGDVATDQSFAVESEPTLGDRPIAVPTSASDTTKVLAPTSAGGTPKLPVPTAEANAGFIPVVSALVSAEFLAASVATAASAAKRLILPPRSIAPSSSVVVHALVRTLRAGGKPVAVELRTKRVVWPRSVAEAELAVASLAKTAQDKRAAFPVTSLEASSLATRGPRAIGKRQVRPSGVTIGKPKEASKPIAAPVPAPISHAPATVVRQAPAAIIRQASATPVAPIAARAPDKPNPVAIVPPALSAVVVKSPPAAVVTPASAPAEFSYRKSVVQATPTTPSKPVPVLRSAAPPVKKSITIMDRYDAWMSENPGQVSREQLIEVGVRQGWLSREDASRAFNVAMHGQRAREIFLMLRDGTTEFYVRRAEATKPTSSEPGRVVRRTAAQVAARRQEAPQYGHAK
ncbi:MAG: hypothetical protein EXR77_16790 [Myxococcales bacterium]|nr:hypothetical protein [Myxococcales bacterium]